MQLYGVYTYPFHPILLRNSFCRSYGINVCGEGGEYETLTLDCPLFNVSPYRYSVVNWKLFLVFGSIVAFIQFVPWLVHLTFLISYDLFSINMILRIQSCEFIASAIN